MAELEGTMSSGRILKEWWERFGKRPELERTSPPLSSGILDTTAPAPSVPTPTEASPVVPPEAPDVMPPTEERNVGSKWTDRLAAGLQDPSKVGLLTAGLSIMATPPRETRYSNTEVLGRGGLAGIQAFQNAVKSSREAKALDLKQEENKLTREGLSAYRKAQITNMQDQRRLEEERINTLGELRADRQAEIQALTANARALDEQVPPEILSKVGLAEFTGKMTYRQLKEAQGALTAAMRPAPMTVTTDKDGTVHVIPKVAGEYPGAGKPKRPPAGAKGARPTTPQWQEQRAEQSLKEQGILKPTVAQIAAERTKLFPKGAGKAASVSPRAALRGGSTAAGEEKVVNGKTYVKKDGQWYEK